MVSREHYQGYQRQALVPTQVKSIRDHDDPALEDYELCRRLGMTVREIFEIIIFSDRVVDAANLLMIHVTDFSRIDNGYFEWMRNWLYNFSVQWRNRIMTLEEQHALSPLPEEVLRIASGLLGIDQDKLRELVERKVDLEIFMDQNRGMLSVMAESRLWSLVDRGDPATIRWVLSKTRPDVYGDKALENDKPKKIEIIEQEGFIE